MGSGFGLKRLGEFRLRDLAEPELIYQLTHADLPADFAPIRTLAERTPALCRCRGARLSAAPARAGADRGPHWVKRAW